MKNLINLVSVDESSDSNKPAHDTETWQNHFIQRYANFYELCSDLQLDPKYFIENDAHLAELAHFPLRVPLGYANKIIKGDYQDPLLLQIIPRSNELKQVPGFKAEPLEEIDYSPTPGVIHKYNGRLLLVATGACAIHCRYCFRRHYPYDEQGVTPQNLNNAMEYIARHNDISEVILSGGDPLSLADHKLVQLIERIELIPHVKRLRLHTRMLGLIPQRLTQRLADLFNSTSLQIVIVLHFNHPNEIDWQAKELTSRLNQLNITVFNQSVLLKGVNSTAQTLMDLSEKLFSHGIIPYYLHLLDQVSGSADFMLEKSQAIELYKILAANLPGYLLPKFVEDIPGQFNKQLIYT